MRIERLPGRKPSPKQRDEYVRIWDAVDDERRKALIFVARGIARDAGLVPPSAPLVMTDRVF